MIGGAGTALLFFMYMIGMIIVGLWVAAYAAHSFLTVVEDTAAGNEDVRWPHDPLVDWAWKLFYLAWLMAVWLVPALIVARIWAADAKPGSAFAVTARIVGGLFWAVFPISLLSSLSASSKWFIFTPTLLPRLAQRPVSVLAFYLLSFLVLLVSVEAGNLLFASDGVWTLLLGACGLACGLLLYGRLFGRLAHVLRGSRDPRTRPVRRAVRRGQLTQAEAAAHVARAGQGVIAARDLPPVNAPDPDARIGYDVRLDDAPGPEPEPERPRPRPIDYDDEPYALGDTEPDAVHRGRLPERLLNPPEFEMAMARRGKAPEPPAHPWLHGVWEFPFYTESRRALAWLSLGLAAVGMLFRLMMSMQVG